MGKTPTKQQPPAPSILRKALDQYIAGLPPKKRVDEFLSACQDVEAEEGIQHAQQLVNDALSQKTTSNGLAATLFKGIVGALQDYNEVISLFGKDLPNINLSALDRVLSSVGGPFASRNRMGRIEDFY